MLDIFFLLLLDSVCHLGKVDVGLDALASKLDLCLEISFSFFEISKKLDDLACRKKDRKQHFVFHEQFFLLSDFLFYLEVKVKAALPEHY